MSDDERKIDVSDIRLQKYHPDATLLRPEPDPWVSNLINTSATAVYGEEQKPLGFRLGNGGAGHTGLLRQLCETFIWHHDGAFRIEWVINHSRHSQIALLGDIVQVALTYEPEWEDMSIAAGWAERVTKAFHDRFILIGPLSNPANVEIGSDIKIAMRCIATHGESDPANALYHTRGDGSATHYKELQLWGLCGVDLAHAGPWRQTKPLAPYDALVLASKANAYAITDRATFLTAQKDGAVPNMRVYVEDGVHLLNPCCALINKKAPVNQKAREFASWLGSQQAQQIIEHFGKDWKQQLPIFAPKDRFHVDSEFSLIGRL